jgi:hypothetical protein
MVNDLTVTRGLLPPRPSPRPPRRCLHGQEVLRHRRRHIMGWHAGRRGGGVTTTVVMTTAAYSRWLAIAAR